MSVHFFPDKQIELLEKFILNEYGQPLQGEINVYRMLFNELSQSKEDWYIWHDLRLPVHSDLLNKYNKTSAQIDFLILCKKGIMVIEVKGGLISLKDNAFYYGKNFEKRIKQNPFTQAEGYKYTLKDKILNNVDKCFFCHCVIFPHVDYQFKSKIFDENILWTKYNSILHDNSIEKFVRSVFNYSKKQHERFNRTYPDLDIKQIEKIKQTLSPRITDRWQFQSINTLEWLEIDNLEILEGLNKNRRIMIEGPPGSGKTTIAKAYIDQQIGKNGIYLCWNNLLMSYMRENLMARNIKDSIRVETLLRFMKMLNPNLNLSEIINLAQDEFYITLKNLLDTRKSNLPSYDYMVIDEGQDLFDRGIDLIINQLCGHDRNGLINGNCLILYDIDQSYLSSGRKIVEIADLFNEYFTHFKLNEVKRSAQNPDIKALAKMVLDNPDVISENDEFHRRFPNIAISAHKNLEEIKKYIVEKLLSQIRSDNSSLRGRKCIVLIESCLMKEKFNDEPGLRYWLTIKDVEELDETNCADQNNKLRYTSILKYKGLEKENVFLIVTKPCEKNKFELYVGITRAISNLEIILLAG